MCGRYYVDDETAREIERIIHIADEKVKRISGAELQLQAKDIHPTDMAPILMPSGNRLCCSLQKWGFPGFEGKQVIFNARSESAMEKKMFQESVERRRIVIPARALSKKCSIVLPVINYVFDFYTFFIFFYLEYKPKVWPEVKNTVLGRYISQSGTADKWRGFQISNFFVIRIQQP